VSEESAQSTLGHIAHLINCHENGRAPNAATDRWLTGLPTSKYDQLARTGLVSPRVSQETKKDYGLIEWIDKYIADRVDVKTTTIETYTRARNSAKDYFGTATRLSAVTSADAAKFAGWLKKKGNRRDKKNAKRGLSPSTVRRTVGKMKQFFGAAIKQGYANLRTAFEKIIQRAGHEQWPGLFVNLRKTRVTELANAGHPLQSVAQWLGHSVDVLIKHYLIARDEDFEAAIAGVTAKEQSPRGDGGGDNGNQQRPNSNPKEK
jgi:hypothetical protein